MRKIGRKLKGLLAPLLYTSDERRHSMVGSKVWKMAREFQICFLKQVGLEPQHHLLDIGCGTLRGGIPIIDYLESGHYCGIESRRNVLDEGRRELEESGLVHKQPRLVLWNGFSSAELERKVDCIWAYSVLIHMEDHILYDTLSFVSRHLEENGSFYANVNTDSQPDGNWQGFPVVHRSLQFYEEACSRNGLTLNDIGSLTDFGLRSSREAHGVQRMIKMTKTPISHCRSSQRVA